MDVDKHSFQSLLLDILTAISRAHFVSIDFEFSGISSRQSFKPAAFEGADTGKQTLQERYEETKEAAERYQILQIGLTCVEENVEDPECPKYITRPYNFYLNPVIQERLDVERIFSYQSGAVEFLLRNGFKMEAPFTVGVPYLSRDEEELARVLGNARGDRSNVADIAVLPTDVESLEFLQRVRGEIEVWKAAETPQYDYLNIALAGHGAQSTSERGLNNFHKRLVHQLVRSDYPDLVTISRPTFIQIVPYDKAREDAVKQSRLTRLEEQLSRQVGFRWLVEAMVQGDLSGVDPKNFARSKDGEPVFVDLGEVNKQLDDVRSVLRDKPTVLVGHNLFTDLVNFHRCFLGPLPLRVKDFQRDMNRIFPMIIDTKYLATHNCGSINPKSSLGEIEAELRSQIVPLIATHPHHTKYAFSAAAHEAGYDSLLTANVLIRLSSKLEASGTWVEGIEEPNQVTALEALRLLSSDADDEDPSAPESSEQSQNPKTAPRKKKTKPKKKKKTKVVAKTRTLTESSSSSGNPPPLTPAQRLAPPPGSPTNQRYSVAKGRIASVFAHPSVYDVLAEDNGEEPETLAEPMPLPAHDTVTLMPPFTSDFWRVYGNKLRVFGTVEGVCDLNPKRPLSIC
ncbi:MAG: hypothetical protein M1836_001063 [Candelina mexicana]|nr:MAG: hypothetical protein M1836_001063 [Candelina mexicana]